MNAQDTVISVDIHLHRRNLKAWALDTLEVNLNERMISTLALCIRDATSSLFHDDADAFVRSRVAVVEEDDDFNITYAITFQNGDVITHKDFMERTSYAMDMAIISALDGLYGEYWGAE